MASLLLVLAASLPIQHMLLIGPDLNGARVLYLPLLGFCLFWALLFERRSTSLLAGSLPVIRIIAAQVIYLEHNLRIWKDVASLSKHTCESFGRELGTDNRPVIVTSLPHKRNGVFFLSNGFPQCVALNSSITAENVQVLEVTPVSWQKSIRLFKWNDSTAKLTAILRK